MITSERKSVRINLLGQGPERGSGRMSTGPTEDQYPNRSLPSIRIEPRSRVRAGRPRLIQAGLRGDGPVVGVHRIVVVLPSASGETGRPLGGRDDATYGLQPSRRREAVGGAVPVCQNDVRLAERVQDTRNAVQQREVAVIRTDRVDHI